MLGYPKPLFVTTLVTSFMFLSITISADIRDIVQSDLILEDQFRISTVESSRDLQGMVEGAPPYRLRSEPIGGCGKRPAGYSRCADSP